MAKAPRGSRKAATSSPDVVPVERPRRSTRLKSTCSKPENIRGEYHTRSKPNRSKPKTQNQPLYTRSASQINSDPNRRLPLFQLPTELLKLIASECLPLESALSLSLTCKEALSVFGTWSWAAFKFEKRWSPIRTNFFSALSRDWQSENGVNVDYEFCTACNTLHPALKPPGLHCKTSLTKSCFGQDACIDHFPGVVQIDNDGNGSEKGYSIVLLHILSALRSTSSYSEKGHYSPPIPLFSDSYSVRYHNLNLDLYLVSSGRRVDGNLLVRHEYTFRKPEISAQDILILRLYLCPHQCATTTLPREKSRYIKSEGRNSPLFTHAVNAAFPAHRQSRTPMNLFRKPTTAEQRNMTEAAAQRFIKSILLLLLYYRVIPILADFSFHIVSQKSSVYLSCLSYPEYNSSLAGHNSSQTSANTIVMAPLPANNADSNGDKAKSGTTYWTKSNIITTTVFIIVVVAILTAALAFVFYRRKENKKLAKRRSDTAGLLANEDKTSMFSRDRASSVTLYVDTDAGARSKRHSTDTMNLIPLHITPVEESRNPITEMAPSAGSGVSSVSRLSMGAQSNVMLSPILQGTDDANSIRPSGRPRSVSTASQRSRYYERTSISGDMPEIPKIVHTPSP
ncbi:kinase-like protein [Curvularia clavata]|uniref:Kinase-like protein n=1 Tax=Curvularia clavata TaxID=95742 RepID=A0A9Q8Z5R0_CURCL|nr:kinase-like protein [Curvularia clavata]